MRVEIVPAFEDNYIFILRDEAAPTAAVVDPGDASPVLSYLKKNSLQLVTIFITHHHADHVGGIRQLKKFFPQARVFASAVDTGRIPEQSDALQEGDSVYFASETARVLFIPGHTRGHIAYFFAGSSPQLFCGDTLFGAGSGGLFEGTYEQMLSSLKKLRSLPPTTTVYCAHEYTEKNLTVALQLEPQNQAVANRLRLVSICREKGLATVPLTLSEELTTNPFLRWDDPVLQAHLKTEGDELATLTAVRKFRDTF